MIYLLFLESYRNAENKRNIDLNSWKRFQNRDREIEIPGKEIKMIKYLFIVTKKIPGFLRISSILTLY